MGFILKIKQYLKLIRIKHWVKNGLIWLPIVFSGQLFEKDKFVSVMLAFISFSFIASAVYVFNDIADVKDDKKHEVKKNRPIASGAISIKAAVFILCSFISASLAINIILLKNYMFCLPILLYFFLNIAYSLILKNIPIIDISVLVSGFLIRLYYGAFVSNIEVSNWLYLTIMSAAFFLVIGKRRNELRKLADSSREVLKHYTFEFLDKHMYLSLALTIVFYSLWTVEPSTIARVNNTHFFTWTVPLLILIFMKYNLSVENKESFGDPVDVLLKDKVLVFMILVYMIVCLILLYGLG